MPNSFCPPARPRLRAEPDNRVWSFAMRDRALRRQRLIRLVCTVAVLISVAAGEPWGSAPRWEFSAWPAVRARAAVLRALMQDRAAAEPARPGSARSEGAREMVRQAD